MSERVARQHYDILLLTMLGEQGESRQLNWNSLDGGREARKERVSLF